MNIANFQNPAYLMRIKAAVIQAVKMANSPCADLGKGRSIVCNRLGKASLLVIAHKAKGFEVFGGEDFDNDVTPLALTGLQMFHKSLNKEAAL